MAALNCVEYVTIFDEPTPREIIAALLPDVLVKGGDRALDRIVGRDEVDAGGGEVLSLPFIERLLDHRFDRTDRATEFARKHRDTETERGRDGEMIERRLFLLPSFSLLSVSVSLCLRGKWRM